jgi:SAM-dependent methyltransferase
MKVKPMSLKGTLKSIERRLPGPVRAPLRSIYRIVNGENSSWQHRSETSKCRARLAGYCEGYGVDLGFGGDPITDSAIRYDMSAPYTAVGAYSVQLGGTAAELHYFRDGVLDFVYSSHLLEDFEDTAAVLKEWWRVLKRGGRLIIYCPHEQRFRSHCAKTGQPYNYCHKHEEFSLEFVLQALMEVGEFNVLYSDPDVDSYSWDLVVEKLR